VDEKIDARIETTIAKSAMATSSSTKENAVCFLPACAIAEEADLVGNLLLVSGRWILHHNAYPERIGIGRDCVCARNAAVEICGAGYGSIRSEITPTFRKVIC
jgi:hypothetical protein